MQSSSSSLSFKQGLIGASPITDANLVNSFWLMVDSACRFPSFFYQLSTFPYQLISLSRCKKFLHAALRRRRFVVQIHVRAPIFKFEVRNQKFEAMTKLEIRLDRKS